MLDLSKKLAALTLPNKMVVPVFSAFDAVQSLYGTRVLNFQKLEIPTCDAHGYFDRDTGVFTFKTPGSYLIQFNGTAFQMPGCQVDLRVNSIIKTTGYCHAADGQPVNAQKPIGFVAISSVVTVKSGDYVDISIRSGSLCEPNIEKSSRFSALLLTC